MTRNMMDKAVTLPAQPRHIIQLIARMPSPLDRLLVHKSRDQMMICQWDVRPFADLASGCKISRLRWGRRRGYEGGEICI